VFKALDIGGEKNRQNLIEVFKTFRGFSNISLYKLFILHTNSKGTRGHTRKLSASMHSSLDCASPRTYRR